MLRIFTAGVVTLGLCASFGAANAQTPDLGSAYAEADVLARGGDFAAAATQIMHLADAYPQDYALQLQSAWYQYQARNYHLALTYYTRADALTNSPGLARLGLAWTHLRLGEFAQARSDFDVYLAANPENPETAHEGIAELHRLESQNAWKFAATASFFLGQYDQNVREDALGGGLAANLGQGAYLATAAYTYGQYGRLAEGMGMGNRQSTTAYTREHLGYASFGYGRRHGGMSVHGTYGNLANAGTSFAAGLTSRLTWFVNEDPNHLRIGLTYGSVLGERLLQGRLTHDFHVLGSIWITPGVLVQLPEDRDVLATGSLALSVQTRLITIVGTGRYGRAHHEMDWSVPLLVTHQEDVLYGTTLGLYLKPSSLWAVGISGAWEHYANQNQNEFQESDGFFGILSLTLFSGGDSQ